MLNRGMFLMILGVFILCCVVLMIEKVLGDLSGIFVRLGIGIVVVLCVSVV